MKSLLLKTAVVAVLALVSFSGTAKADCLPGVHDDYPVPGEGCPDLGDSDSPRSSRLPGVLSVRRRSDSRSCRSLGPSCADNQAWSPPRPASARRSPMNLSGWGVSRLLPRLPGARNLPVLSGVG